MKVRKKEVQATAVGPLPRGTIDRVSLGSSFAEYDRELHKLGVFVETPAARAALAEPQTKCFFVGRRGTGKTAITYYILQRYEKNCVHLLPQIFSSLADYFGPNRIREVRDRSFKSAVICFKRAILDEVLRHWITRGYFSFDRVKGALTRERNLVEDFDFDSRLVTLIDRHFSLLEYRNHKTGSRRLTRRRK